MFYELKDELREIGFSQINKKNLTVGFVSSDELAEIGKDLGFDEDTIEASRKANPLFRTGVDVRKNYTFAELKIVNIDGHEDFFSIFVKENFLLIVDIIDEDSSTLNSLQKALQKYPCAKINEERIICAFMEALLSGGNVISEEIRNSLTEMEEAIVRGETEKDFNVNLLEMKKKLLKFYNYYEQILDIAETLEENDNDILIEDNIIYITNLSAKISRLKDDINTLSNMADHIQDAYATMLDQKMNSTMKVFTVITTIFFPLTIIVGWYGMNFQNMPELTWKYGYLFVSVLSVVIVTVLIFIGKRKKWF